MRVETFLDYNKILKVIFELSKERIDYDFICSTEDGHLSQSIIENLKNISSLSETENPDICRLSINDTIFININKNTGEIESVNNLTAFETRLLAQGKEKHVPFSREDMTDFSPKTDLHTHFAGALTPDSMIRVGIEHDIGYPADKLKEMGVDVSHYSIDKENKIKLASLSEGDIKNLKQHLIISPVTQETFNTMEEIYAYRGPFTKNREMFPDFLRELANDYKKNGVNYAELSYSSLTEGWKPEEYMQMLEDNLPQIEQETGVKLRFLAGLWRHSDEPYNQDIIDTLVTVAKSPYIVGCDYMGHESNQSLDFKEQLERLADYAMENDPNFAIRVHAGENPIYKTNMYDALKIVYDQHAKRQQEENERAQKEGRTPNKIVMPQVRIGHGLYGLDIKEDGNYKTVEQDGVIKLIKEMGAIVEFNMSSNLALNNINDISTIPIKRYVDAGVDVVLGTDGHGLYSTFGKQEALLATAAGLEKEDFEKLVQTEKKVLDRARQREQTHPRISNVKELYDSVIHTGENGGKHYTPEVDRKIKEEKQARVDALLQKIEKTGAETNPEKSEEITKGKTPIVLTGASKKAWPNILPKDQEYIRLAMQVLANTLDPDKAFVVTGGTNFGVEKEMHEAGHRRNEKSDKDLVVLGTLTMEANLDKDKVEPNTITHAIVLKTGGNFTKNWMDLPYTQIRYATERDGHIVAVGGGSVVSDYIQVAHNSGVKNLHLMDGPYGASTDKSKSLNGNGYSFKTIEELIQRLYERTPEMFGKDFSIENIEQYINQAKLDITPIGKENNPANFGLGAMHEIHEGLTAADREKGAKKLVEAIKEKSKEVSEVRG
mgnify:FL=1